MKRTLKRDPFHVRSIVLLAAAMTVVAGMLVFSGCGSGTDSGKWSGPREVAVPWGDYEEGIYSLKASGEAVDEMKFIIEKAQMDGKNVYKMQLPLLVKDGEYNSGAVLEADTLKPLSSFYRRHPPGQYKDRGVDITGQYGEKLAVHAEGSKVRQNWELGLSGECVDNESIPMVIRAFPLKEGFKRTVNLVILSVVKAAPFEVRVAGREKVTVPAGEFDCYRVELQYKGFLPAPALNFWYSADERKLMVKSVQGATVLELKEVKYDSAAKNSE